MSGYSGTNDQGNTWTVQEDIAGRQTGYDYDNEDGSSYHREFPSEDAPGMSSYDPGDSGKGQAWTEEDGGERQYGSSQDAPDSPTDKAEPAADDGMLEPEYDDLGMPEPNEEAGIDPFDDEDDVGPPADEPLYDDDGPAPAEDDLQDDYDDENDD